MATPQEQDYPPGHPARFDYDARSPEAKEWRRLHLHPKGERDFPPGHPKAVDTPGNMNAVQHVAGVDPNNPELEQFTGRTPEQAAAHRDALAEATALAMESPILTPIEAPDPPPPGDISKPTGQPNT